jgi:hypothetical protein
MFVDSIKNQKKKKTKPQAFAQKRQSRRIWTFLNNKMIKDLFVHHSDPTPCSLHEFQARRRTKTITVSRPKNREKKEFLSSSKIEQRKIGKS